MSARGRYDPASMVQTPALRLDSLPLSRIDLIKIDVEGMELEGARHRCKSTNQSSSLKSSNRTGQSCSNFSIGLVIPSINLGGSICFAVHKTDKTAGDVAKRNWAAETV